MTGIGPSSVKGPGAPGNTLLSVKIPYVIDNQRHRLVDVLKDLLTDHARKSLDIATAYFTISAFGMLREGIEALGNFRLLLGAEPRAAEQIGLRPEVTALAAAIRGDLEREPFAEATLRLVEDFAAVPQSGFRASSSTGPATHRRSPRQKCRPSPYAVARQRPGSTSTTRPSTTRRARCCVIMRRSAASTKGAWAWGG